MTAWEPASSAVERSIAIATLSLSRSMSSFSSAVNSRASLKRKATMPKLRPREQGQARPGVEPGLLRAARLEPDYAARAKDASAVRAARSSPARASRRARAAMLVSRWAGSADARPLWEALGSAMVA